MQGAPGTPSSPRFFARAPQPLNPPSSKLMRKCATRKLVSCVRGTPPRCTRWGRKLRLRAQARGAEPRASLSLSRLGDLRPQVLSARTLSLGAGGQAGPCTLLPKKSNWNYSEIWGREWAGGHGRGADVPGRVVRVFEGSVQSVSAKVRSGWPQWLRHRPV